MNELVPVGAVRTVGNFFTVFAVESFIDEVAHKIGVDPLDLRLSCSGRGVTLGHLPGNPGEEVLRGSSQVTVGGGSVGKRLEGGCGQANYGSPLMKRNTAQVSRWLPRKVVQPPLPPAWPLLSAVQAVTLK